MIFGTIYVIDCLQNCRLIPIFNKHYFIFQLLTEKYIIFINSLPLSTRFLIYLCNYAETKRNYSIWYYSIL